ncbi:hypothetical protein SKa4_00072 [Pseudomonas phage vB_PpuM-SKa-4]
MSKTRNTPRCPRVTAMVTYYQKNKADIHAQCLNYNFPPEQFRMFREEILQRMEYRGESIDTAIDAILLRMRDHALSIHPVVPLRFHEDGMPNTGDWQAMLSTLNNGDVPHAAY